MTKFFKRTFAFFIAVIMMISSFPYMALAEDTASATEGSTTAEMTNADLEKYIDSKINNASFTLPEEQRVATAGKDYMSGVYTKATFNDLHDTTDLELPDGVKAQFTTTKLQYAVAIYTGQNDIRFPVIVTKNSTKGNDQSCYIRYISIPKEYDASFEFGENWQRCKGGSKYDLTVDSDPQNFSSIYGGDRLTKNSFRMSETKYWRNYIKYTGSGDEEKYYEALPTSEIKPYNFVNKTSLDIGFQYGNTQVTGSLGFWHNAYVLNLKPYRIILENIKNDYTEIKNNKSLYKEESLNKYYKAVRDVLDFDIKTLLSNMTSNPKTFSTEIADIATKVKTVVENYNLAKKVNMDSTAFKAKKEECDIIINNQRENAEYDSNSFAEFKKKYDEVIVKAETVENQEALDDLTKQLVTAQNSLQKRKFTITFKIYKNDSSKPYHEPSEHECEYGEKYKFDTNIDKAKECVKRWIVYTDGDKIRTVVGTTDSMFTLYVTKDATIEAYVVPLKENAKPVDYSKVVFYGFNNKVIDVQYLEKGKILTSGEYTNPPKVPFYEFDSWDKTSVTGNGEDIIVRANYRAETSAQKCTVHYDRFENGSKAYDYDQYVHLPDVQDGEYFALVTKYYGISTILTYLNCNEFHAPKTQDIYVVPVKKEDRVAKVAITGSYATRIDKDGNIVSGTDFAKKRVVFNCKFYLPEDCTPIEWGAQISDPDRTKTRVVKGEKLSKYNEYSIYMNVPNNSTIRGFRGIAYVRYKDSKHNIKTIYSAEIGQAFN